VSIRVRVPESTAGLVHVAPAPLVETMLSLHVLMHPKEHPLQHPWIRSMRTLSPALKREIRAFWFLYSDITADFMLPERADAPQSFDEALAAFAALPPERAQYEIARPAFFYFEPGAGPESLADEEVLERIRRRAGETLTKQLLEDPAAVQARIVDMLATYWAESFAAEWERLEPALQEETERARDEDPIALLKACAVTCLKRTATDPQVQRVFDVVTHKCEYLGEMAGVNNRISAVQKGCVDRSEQAIRNAVKRGLLPASVNPRLAAVGLDAMLFGRMPKRLPQPAYGTGGDGRAHAA